MRTLNLSANDFIFPDADKSSDIYQQLLRLLTQCTSKEQKNLLENARTLVNNRDEAPQT